NSDRIFCFAVTSVSLLPSRNLPMLALFGAYGRPSRIKHRELRRIAAKQKAIRVCRLRQDQWTAGISQPLGYDFLRRAERSPRMEPGRRRSLTDGAAFAERRVLGRWLPGLMERQRTRLSPRLAPRR